MRPLRSFLLLLIFLACFTGLHYIIHGDQLFPSINEFVPSDIIKGLFSGDKKEARISPDTIRIYYSDTIHANALVKGESASAPLRNYLDSLRLLKQQLRIVYYGDSQIEGDRITSYLRHNLRKYYGGTGPGLFLPLMGVMYTKSLWVRSSSNWKKYNYLSYRAGEISHKNLGPLMSICRFLPEGVTAQLPEKAFVKIRPSGSADSAAANYDFLRIFYGNNAGRVNISVKADNRLIYSDTLKWGNGYNELKCSLNNKKDILVEFEGKTSPDIYGISIESDSGIVVDNIPQRGSAGLEFTMVGRENLEESFKKLSPDLVILQYGLNIVKNIKDDYSYYEKGLIRQISLLKAISPPTSILVVGVTDMASSQGDSIKSYTNISNIIEAQNRATQQTGVFFWNSYDAMGGRSSIIRWADKKPPLAQKDYVHFTYPGADTLSSMLVAAVFLKHKTDSATSSISQSRIPAAPVIKIDEHKQITLTSPVKGLIASIFNFNPDKPFLFTSPAFWIFFLVVLLGYSIIYKKILIRNIYLFLISLFFYYKAGGMFLFILIFVTVIDYSCGILINSSEKRSVRRFFVLLSITSNLVLLGYFKYAGFIIDSVNKIAGTHFAVYDMLSGFSNSILGTHFDISYIILPVGISFFIFQSLSYTIDVYRKKMEPVRNIVDFGFYVSFFPHLVAGPIVRASVFIPQIYQEFKLSKPEFSHAIYMISKGLIKKIVISNFIAISMVDRIFDTPALYSGFENLLAIYGYGLQIYCDFSGYTDIAIGVALILGFRLPVNFNSPYKAKSITDFWKRWHISLSQWLKDYLYISLGGNRKGKIRTYFNLLITMLLGGLWHGASLRYVIWGGLHGIGLVFNRLWKSIFRQRPSVGWIGRVMAVFLTFQFVNFCWIFFRAPDMGSVKLMFNQIFQNFSPGSYLTLLPVYGSVLILMAVGYIIHFLPETVKESYRGLFIKLPMAVQMTAVLAVAVLLFQMRTTQVIPFIYFRF